VEQVSLLAVKVLAEASQHFQQLVQLAAEAAEDTLADLYYQIAVALVAAVQAVFQQAVPRELLVTQVRILQ
jgi:hypothetical protein